MANARNGMYSKVSIFFISPMIMHIPDRIETVKTNKCQALKSFSKSIKFLLLSFNLMTLGLPVGKAKAPMLVSYKTVDHYIVCSCPCFYEIFQRFGFISSVSVAITLSEG